MTKLIDDEIKRYDRHLKLDGFGLEKQIKLKQAKVLIVGAGGLGCPIALYLAAAGVGKITIVDDDKVELSNLQRQIAFSVTEIGELKAAALAKRIAQLNPLIEIAHLPIRLDANNVENTITGYDLVIDGTDNFASRFLIADACYLANITYLHASVHQYQGQISLFVPGKTPCFRCLYRQPPSTGALPACGEAGILGVVTGAIGVMTASEAVKYIAGFGDSMAGKVLMYDTLSQDLKKINIERDANCPLCSQNGAIRKMPNLSYAEQSDDNCLQRMELKEQIITIARAAGLMKQTDSNKQITLLDVREQKEYDQGHLKNAKLWPLSMLRSIPMEALVSELQTIIGFEQRDKLGRTDKLNGKQLMIICYCQRGTRSLKAVSLLQEAGLSNIVSLEGGFEAWQAERYSW